MVVTNKLLIFVSTRNTNTKNNIMRLTDLQITIKSLDAAHAAKDRDAKLVAALFTMAQNLGGKLKAYEYSATSGNIARVWDAQKSHR